MRTAYGRQEGEEEADSTPGMNKKGKKRRIRQGPSPQKKSPITLSDYAEEQKMDRAAEEQLLEDCKLGKPPAGYTVVDPTHPDMQGKELLFQVMYLVPVVEVTQQSGPGGLRAQIGVFMSKRNELKEETLTLDTTKEENRARERAQELTLQGAKDEQELKEKKAKEVREEAKEKRAAKAQKQQMKLQSQQMKMQLAMMKKMGVLASESDESSEAGEE